jgi:hypothetical protein
MVYGMKTLNGDLLPWRLRPRDMPMPVESSVAVSTVRACQSITSIDDWTAFLMAKGGGEGDTPTTTMRLPRDSVHTLELQADVHSTAFLRWTFKAAKQSRIKLKLTYSEGYELEPRSYPYFRTKADQVNYPLAVKASWKDCDDVQSEEIWNVSIRTMRNCMFDGYSDCPFYEQLQ